jgi:hypothetical protein
VLHSACHATASSLIAAPAAFAAGSSTAGAWLLLLLLLLLHLLLPLALQWCQWANHAAYSLAGAVLLRRL